MQMPQMQQHTMPQHMQMSGNAQLPNMGNGMGNMNMNNIGNMQSSNSRQHQRSFSASGIKGNWQSDKDIPHRRQMIQEIVKILKKDKNGNADWLSKLPNMAKQLEVSLYRNARSFEEYTNMSTLKHRLQLIAREVSHKAKPATDQPPVSQGNNNFNNNGMMNQQNDLMREKCLRQQYEHEPNEQHG